MRPRVIPGRRAVLALGAAAGAVLAALLVGLPVVVASRVALACLLTLLAATAWDWASSQRAWRRASPTMTRRLPAAFALGVKRPVQLVLSCEGPETWRCHLHDHADPSLLTEGLPVRFSLSAAARIEATYMVTSTRRGATTFAAADVRVRSRWGLCELLEQIGTEEVRRVYPDFSQVARYAWLAGDHRLPEIGVKTYQQRGRGTDFDQLSEYRVGDAVRHMDWRATLRLGKPIVRQFQDERDQSVLLMLDCGRRMRADDRHDGLGATHFDQALNALMLLTYVALKDGDAVGAMTFGTPAGEERAFAPRKGAQTLSALMGHLYDVQPSPTHSDYLTAAQDLLRRQHKRSLVIVMTNFRDEDSTEVSAAIRLLRSRHLVLLATLREHVVGELMAQPLDSGDAVIDVASAHLYEQARRDALHRLGSSHALMVDAEPARLGVELVNRYHAIKRAGMI